jgi:hypothetical protein
MVFSHGLRIAEAILQHQCWVKYDAVSSLHHTSSLDVTNAPERANGCETLSKRQQRWVVVM